MSPLNITQPLGIWSMPWLLFQVMSNIPKMGHLMTHDIGVLITSNKYVLLAAGSARCHINGIVKDKLWVTCPNLGVM